MTTVVVARGSDWSADSLYDGWGEGPDGFETEMGNLVVERFEELAQAAGFPANWLPSLSEVHADIDLDLGDEPENPLDALREQATEEVWNALTGEWGPMADRVGRAMVPLYLADAKDGIEAVYFTTHREHYPRYHNVWVLGPAPDAQSLKSRIRETKDEREYVLLLFEDGYQMAALKEKVIPNRRVADMGR